MSKKKVSIAYAVNFGGFTSEQYSFLQKIDLSMFTPGHTFSSVLQSTLRAWAPVYLLMQKGPSN